jgi:hypothetical protein
MVRSMEQKIDYIFSHNKSKHHDDSVENYVLLDSSCGRGHSFLRRLLGESILQWSSW